MISSENNNILYSFLIPVYNTGVLLYETLDSVANQNFDLDSFQVIIVDDCSTDKDTIAIIDQLIENPFYKGLKLEVDRNKKNSWLAETRNIAARKAIGKYLVCLDSDDILEPDYIIHCHLAFAAYPNASWVYPSVRKFSYRNQIDIMSDFSAKQLFLSNYVVAVSPVKRELWEKLKGQKTIKISDNVKLFEDWDFWQRALGRGRFGVPIKKVIFNYRQNITSLITRSEDEGNLSTIIAYRKNWTTVFGLRASQKGYEKDNNQFKSNFGFITKIIRKVIKITLKRNPANLKFSDLFLYVFFPKRFIKVKSNSSRTKALKMAGFITGFPLNDLYKSNYQESKKINNTIFFTHFWWHVGGAENILFDYMNVVQKSGSKIVDIVNTSFEESGTLRTRFSKIADEQFALDEIAEGPYPRLLALLELIKLERPRIIMNMSNPFIYALSPVLKRMFPEMQIYDLLHCEEYNENGWFETAYHYQQWIDKRIVISEFWKKVLIEKYKEKPEKINVVYNMIDYASFKNSRKDRNEGLKNFNINPNKKIIGFLGRFHEQKRPDLFIELADKMQYFPDYHFVMAGDGEMLPELMDKMKSIQNLTYLGPTKQPENILPLFDIAVFPSRFEGYALVSMECACLSIPVVVPNINGFNEQIKNGRFGLVYEIKSDNEDVETIIHLITNKYDEIIELGKNGPEFIEKYHNESKIKACISELFKNKQEFNI